MSRHNPNSIENEISMTDPPISPDSKAEHQSTRSQVPQFMKNIQQFDDPLNKPLINTSNSIAYSLSNSISDPFSNLIRHLFISQETSEEFHQIAQYLATNMPSTNFIPILFQLFIDENGNGNAQCRYLALQSLRVLSINDAQFCKDILCHKDFVNHLLPQLKEQQFTIEILQLLTCICQFMGELDDPKAMANIIKSEIQKNVKTTHDLDEYVLAVMAILSRYDCEFTDEDVKKIIKNINFPGKAPLRCVWSCLECIDNFLAQKMLNKFGALEENKDNLIAKLGHAIICVKQEEDPNLLMMIMKVLLTSIDMIQIKEPAESLKEFRLEFVSRLIDMKSSNDRSLSMMSETVLKRLGLIQGNLQ